MRKFNYTGERLTCLWCGRRLVEKPHTIQASARSVRPVVGSVVDYDGAQRRVRDVFDMTWTFGRRARLHQTRPGEPVQVYHVYYDPPVYDAWYRDDPMFDTKDCAAAFGLWHARNGKRLAKPKTPSEVEQLQAELKRLRGALGPEDPE